MHKVMHFTLYGFCMILFDIAAGSIAGRQQRIIILFRECIPVFDEQITFLKLPLALNARQGTVQMLKDAF